MCLDWEFDRPGANGADAVPDIVARSGWEHPGGTNAARLDGHVRFLRGDTGAADIRIESRIKPAGG